MESDMAVDFSLFLPSFQIFYEPAVEMPPGYAPVEGEQQQTIRYTWSTGTSKTATTNQERSESVTDSITQSLSERLRLPERSTTTPRKHKPADATSSR